MTTPIEVQGLIFAQPKPGLPAMWGSAAWAQSQLTPGVSALAAPPPYMPVGARTERKGEPMNPVGVLAVFGGIHF
jgi:hypothetical protein